MPIGQDDDLPVVAGFEQLLSAPVHVADYRRRGDDELAIERQNQPQHAVRRRVLRADVQHHLFGVKTGRCGPDDY